MEEFRASLRKPEAKYTLPAWHESELKNREKNRQKARARSRIGVLQNRK